MLLIDCFCFFFLMIRRPPRSTRTDTLFPYTTLFRSASFKQQVSHDLRKDIKSETSGNFRQILLKRFDPPFLQKAKALHKAMKGAGTNDGRSEEHTSELQSLMRISYAVFCLKKKHKNT